MKTIFAITCGLIVPIAILQSATPPVPPVYTAPGPPSPPGSTTTYVATNAIAVTSAVLTTNYVLVTNSFTVTNPAPADERYVYQQKLFESGPSWLITPEQAQSILNRFRVHYTNMGNPRMLIYVNRDLVDEQTGMKLSARSERIEVTRGHTGGESQGGANASLDTNNASLAGGKSLQNQEKMSQDNVYRIQGRKDDSLADRQTVRDVERLFGRPLRMGGIRLADQRIATQLIGDKPIPSFVTPTEGEQARKDREALSKIADIVLEVLISSRQMVAPGITADRTYTVPDIHATAIRLSDSQILGQATASDLVGRTSRSFDVRDVAEATALSLMEDMLSGAQ